MDDKQTQNIFKILQSTQKVYEKGWPSETKYDPRDHRTVRATHEMLHCLDQRPEIELDAKILTAGPQGLITRKMNRESFRESWFRDSSHALKMLETDGFATDIQTSNSVGNDFTPLLGGAFYKNLYYWGGTGESYIQMHSDAFYAYHHDPIAKALIEITRNFVLGNGFDVQTDQNDKYGRMAMVAWKAFEAANDLQEQVSQAVIEQSIYGENMWWWLPNQQTKIIFQIPGMEMPPLGVIPRVRLMDPSMYIEIVTYPEDITRKLFYVTLVPTQYQIYGNNNGIPGNNGMPEPSMGSSINQPTLKFIYQQTPADQILHTKINGVSNEKRGRSDLFPIFGYLKRLRDMVEYAMIALQKNAAWGIDTTVKGDTGDINQYIAAQQALGTIAPAGSEFVHSEGVSRQYQANAGSKGAQSPEILQWALSFCCAGMGIPVNYLALHLSGGQTRASAIVATEPVAKKMEHRRKQNERMLKKMWEKVMATAGLPLVDCDFVFPELITQDRSQKFQDLLLAQQARWIAPSRAAGMFAKDMQIEDYDYKAELAEMKMELPEVPMPLVDPGKMPAPGDIATDGMSGQDRSEVKHNDSEF